MTRVEQIRRHWSVALRPDVASGVVLSLATKQSWRLVEDAPRGHSSGRCRTWLVDDSQVDLLEQHHTGGRYVTVTGQRSLLDQLIGLVPLADDTELLDQATAADSPLTRIWALNALAYLQIGVALNTAHPDPNDTAHLAFPNNQRYLATFQRLLDDPSPGVRRAAVRALGGSQWPGARAVLQRHREQSPELTANIDHYLARAPLRIPSDTR